MPLLPALLLAAVSASDPSVIQDRPDLWEAAWSLGTWSLDSSHGPSVVDAPDYGVEDRPGALQGPVARAVVALPPRGGWTVEIQRDSVLDLAGRSWGRVDLWTGSPPTARAAVPVQPEDWTQATTPNGRILRLAIPWAVSVGSGVRLARSLRVTVRMTGNGESALDRNLAAMVANPVGSRRFGDRPATALLAARTAAGSVPVLPQGERCLVASVRASAPGSLSQDGMVRIDGATLARRLGSLSGISFDRVAVSTGGRGAVPLTTDSVTPAVGQDRIPIRRIDLDGDGAFDPEDRIEFYAQGPSYWQPDPALGPGIHSLVVHPWDLSHRYLVRLDAPEGSPELALASRPSAPRTVVSTLRPVWGGRHRELEKEEAVESGADWFWKTAIGTGLSENDLVHEATTDLPGLASPEGYATVRLVDRNPDRSDTILVSGRGSTLLSTSARNALWRTTALKAAGNRYRWKLGFGGSAAFESITIHYAYAPSIADLRPFPAPLVGAFALAIAGATERDTLVAVERGVGVRRIPIADGVLRDSASTPDTWYVSAQASPLEDLAPWTSPNGPFQIAPDRFRSREDVDLLVVAPDSFLDLASEYARFRADPARVRPFRTGIVRSEDLWLATGHGSQDPLAIRDFLIAVRTLWNPSHVLLLGGGHFDPRGILGASPGPLPIYETGKKATDALLQYLDPGEATSSSRIRDVALGRIPARSRAEVRNWIAKLHAWEDPARASWGPWRRNFLAAADDLQNIEVKGTNLDDGFLGASGHTESSERILARIAQRRPWLRIHKVYEMEYPPNAAKEKPEAGRDLLEELNAGTAAWQYIGHGGWNILSHERILDTQTALAQLRNASQPFFMIAGSCTVGRHDMAFARGLSEALVVADGKGAIGAVAGTRISFGPPNEVLVGNFWARLFERTSSGAPRTFGEALALAGTDENSEVYNLLGDPAMTMPFGGTPLAPTRTPRTLAALDTFLVQGRADAELAIELRTRSTPTTAYYQPPGETTRYLQKYLLPGRTLLSQRSRSNAGSFATTLKVPGKVPFGDSATLSIYAWDPAAQRDSAWMDTTILMSGVGTSVSTDREGPAIRILPCDSSWSAGRPFGRVAEVPVPFCLNILLDDSSGISSSDAPDEGVILSVPGTLEPWHPSQIGEGSDFSRAVVRLDLDPGVFQAGKAYPLQVFARDLMGNASTASLEIHPRAEGEVDLYEVFNRPNPAKGGTTTFFFKLLATADSNGTVPSTVQASIRIHTISGKLVRILQTDLTEVGHPRPRAVWDLKDDFRNEVANGLYPYVVRLRVKDPSGGNWRQVERRGIVAVSR